MIKKAGILFFFFVFFSSFIFGNTQNQENSLFQEEGQEKTLSLEEQRVLQEQTVLENIETFKYSTHNTKRQEAMDFIFDNLNIARSFLYDELVISENDDLILANIFLILSYDEKPINLDKILDSLEIQSQKIRYLQRVLNFLYANHLETCIYKIKGYFLSSSFHLKNMAIAVMQENAHPSFKSLLWKELQKETNPWFLEKILKALAFYSFNLKEAEFFLKMTKNPSQGVREGAVENLKNHPDLWPLVKTRLKKSDNIFEKQSLLELVRVWEPLPEIILTLLELGEDQSLWDFILECFLFWGKKEFKNFNLLPNFYQSSSNLLQKFTLLASGMLYSTALKEGQEEIFLWYEKLLHSKIKEPFRYEIYKIFAKNSHTISETCLVELKNNFFKGESFRNQKLIQQILDLNLKI